MHKKSKFSIKEALTFAGVVLVIVAMIACDQRYNQYREYAKEHNCQWVVLANGKEICQ